MLQSSLRDSCSMTECDAHPLATQASKSETSRKELREAFPNPTPQRDLCPVHEIASRNHSRKIGDEIWSGHPHSAYPSTNPTLTLAKAWPRKNWKQTCHLMVFGNLCWQHLWLTTLQDTLCPRRPHCLLHLVALLPHTPPSNKALRQG